jgi:hypothetical protein
MAQRWSAISWTQRTPAGLPSGMPGIGLLMEGAVQQAPQPGRQSMPRQPSASCSVLALATAVSRGSATAFFTARISAMTLTAISGGVLLPM